MSTDDQKPPSLYDLWLAVNPISDELRRSLSIKIAFLAEARRCGLIDPIEVARAYEAFVEQKIKQSIE